jgi:hypothetical protein
MPGAEDEGIALQMDHQDNGDANGSDGTPEAAPKDTSGTVQGQEVNIVPAYVPQYLKELHGGDVVFLNFPDNPKMFLGIEPEQSTIDLHESHDPSDIKQKQVGDGQRFTIMKVDAKAFKKEGLIHFSDDPILSGDQVVLRLDACYLDPAIGLYLDYDHKNGSTLLPRMSDMRGPDDEGPFLTIEKYDEDGSKMEECPICTTDTVYFKFTKTKHYINFDGQSVAIEEGRKNGMTLHKRIKVSKYEEGPDSLDCIQVSQFINDYRVRGYSSMLMFLGMLISFMYIATHDLAVSESNAQNTMILGTIPALAMNRWTGGTAGTIWSMIGPLGLPAGGLIVGNLIGGVFKTPRNYTNATYEHFSGTYNNGTHNNVPWHNTAVSYQTGYDFGPGRVLGGFRVTVTPKLRQDSCPNKVLEPTAPCYHYMTDTTHKAGYALLPQTYTVVNQTAIDLQMANLLATAYQFNETETYNLNYTNPEYFTEEMKSWERSHKEEQAKLLKKRTKAIQKQLKAAKAKTGGACTGPTWSCTTYQVVKPPIVIPWDERNEGYSVFFNSAMSKPQLTNVANRLKLGNFITKEATQTVKIHYIVYFPDSNSYGKLVARYDDDGDGVFSIDPGAPDFGTPRTSVYKVHKQVLPIWVPDSKGELSWVIAPGMVFAFVFFMISWVSQCYRFLLGFFGEMYARFQMHTRERHTTQSRRLKAAKTKAKKKMLTSGVNKAGELMIRHDPTWWEMFFHMPRYYDGSQMFALPMLFNAFMFATLFSYFYAYGAGARLDDYTSNEAWATKAFNNTVLVNRGVPVIQKDIDDMWLNYESNIKELLDDVDAFHEAMDAYNYLTCLTCIIATMRLLQYLNFQHYLNTMTESFQSVANDLFHTMILLMIVIIGFAMAGYFAMAQHNAENRSIALSISHTTQIALGIAAPNRIAMNAVGVFGMIYVVLLKVMVVLIAFKALLAIIIVAYKATLKSHNDALRSIVGDVKLMIYVSWDSWVASFYYLGDMMENGAKTMDKWCRSDDGSGSGDDKPGCCQSCVAGMIKGSRWCYRNICCFCCDRMYKCATKDNTAENPESAEGAAEAAEDAEHEAGAEEGYFAVRPHYVPPETIMKVLKNKRNEDAKTGWKLIISLFLTIGIDKMQETADEAKKKLKKETEKLVLIGTPMDVLCMQFRCMQWQHDEKKGKYDPDFKEKVKAPKPEKKKLKEKKSKVEVDMAELIHLLRKAKRQKAIKDAFIENQYNFLTPDWKRNTEGAKFMEKVEYRIFGVDWIFGNTAKKTAGLWDRFCCCCTSVMSTAEKPKQSEKAIPSLEVEDGDDEKLQEALATQFRSIIKLI